MCGRDALRSGKKRELRQRTWNQAIQEEVRKLVDAGIMKEVHYHSWLSNMVMVKKHNGSWRMVNKACPKDGYPLPEIDWKVESLCRFPFNCFLDAYKGYHQIKMAKEDEEKTTFIMSQGIFCYSKMPFGLRNARATYQPDLPTLTAPEEKEELIVYLAATKEAGSAVLMTERDAKQMPIYFVSRTLRGPEVNYTSMEKLVRVLVHAIKRLKIYFQAHPIIVVTDQPIKQVFSKPEVARRLQKWSIELGEYAIHYRPRVSVKGQILADFIVERPEEDSLDTSMEVKEELLEPWVLFTDGSSCADDSGAGLILTNPEGMEFTYALRFRFEATNNEVNGTYIAKEADMIQYLEKVRTLTNGFQMFSIKQVPRSKNKKADALSKITFASFAHLSKQVLVEELKEKSINKVEVLTVVEEEGDTWMTPIYEYLTEETLPAEVYKARAV
ncbi:reverse transcriptase domain-containing protein [Tanacetum coccineum]